MCGNQSIQLQKARCKNVKNISHSLDTTAAKHLLLAVHYQRIPNMSKTPNAAPIKHEPQQRRTRHTWPGPGCQHAATPSCQTGLGLTVSPWHLVTESTPRPGRLRHKKKAKQNGGAHNGSRDFFVPPSAD